LTPEQRSQSAKKAVTARWAKVKANPGKATSTATKLDSSGNTLVDLLSRLKATVEPTEIRELADRIERVIFHTALK
jgi:hypothetical protein